MSYLNINRGSKSNKIVYAGIWRRLVATLIDFVLLLAFLIPVYLVIKGLPLTVAGVANHWAFNLVWLFSLVVFWATSGATPGKRLMNCKIVKINKDGTISDITWLTAGLRVLACIVSAVPIFIGFIWIAFDKNRRAFHDLILSTSVIIDEENYEDIGLDKLMAVFPK